MTITNKPIALTHSQLCALRLVKSRGISRRKDFADWYVAMNTIWSLVARGLVAWGPRANDEGKEERAWWISIAGEAILESETPGRKPS